MPAQFRSTLIFLLFILHSIQCKHASFSSVIKKRQSPWAPSKGGSIVRSGIVPIFNEFGRLVTDTPPITFTFTTPAQPVIFRHTQSALQFRFTPSPSRFVRYSTMTQAPYTMTTLPPQSHYYVYQPPPSDEIGNDRNGNGLDREYGRIWNQMKNSWKKMKQTFTESDIADDWQRMVSKMSTTITPFLMQVSEKLGEAMEVAMRYYQQPKSTSNGHSHRFPNGHSSQPAETIERDRKNSKEPSFVNGLLGRLFKDDDQHRL